MHLAQALVEAGHARNMREAFDRFMGDGSGTVPAVDLDFCEAIAIARSHGGVTSWAHPPLSKVQEWTPTFVRSGLQGLEGYRPGVGASHRKTMRKLARKRGLFLTGGSDWHGWGPRRLGDFAVDDQQARGFVKALHAA